jgi:hypothetical protein
VSRRQHERQVQGVKSLHEKRTYFRTTIGERRHSMLELIPRNEYDDIS